MASYAIDNDAYGNDIASRQTTVNGLKYNFGKQPQKFKDAIDDIPRRKLESMRDMSWDKLDKDGLLNDLKVQSIQTYRRKYLEKFGIPYKETK